MKEFILIHDLILYNVIAHQSLSYGRQQNSSLCICLCINRTLDHGHKGFERTALK